MKINKQKLGLVLRKIRLLKLLDYYHFTKDVAKHKEQNRIFRASHPDFSVPSTSIAFDAYNHTSWQAYRSSGLEHARFISQCIAEYLGNKPLNICEWGCGAARVIRHFPALVQSEKLALYGTDYNGKTIDWCRKNITDIAFFRNDLKPPLPFESDMFDCIYGLSVFTHLSEELHYAWIRELARVTRPGGIILITTHGDFYRNTLIKGEMIRYDAGQLVVRGNYQEGKKSFVAYHPEPFMRNTLLSMIQPDASSIMHIPEGIQQDVWIIRR